MVPSRTVLIEADFEKNEGAPGVITNLRKKKDLRQIIIRERGP